MSLTHVSVSVTAGTIRPAHSSPDCFVMDDAIGASVFMMFTPEVARQWIATLTPLAGEK